MKGIIGLVAVLLVYRSHSLDVDPAPPVHEVDMNGTFYTVNSANIDIDCLTRYSDSIRRKGQTALYNLNVLLDSGGICGAYPGVRVITVDSLVQADGSKGFVQYDFNTVGSRNNTMAEVQSCGAELTRHLEDLNNWGRPLVPDLPGCPAIQFIPDRLLDQGRQWSCPYDAGKHQDE